MLSLIIAGWKTKPFQKRQSKEAKTNTGTEIWSGIGNTWKKKKRHIMGVILVYWVSSFFP